MKPFNFLACISLSMSISVSATSAERTPWIKPVTAGWTVQPLLDSGEKISGYSMAGIPDGLGALRNVDGTLSIFVNHEIASEKGMHRLHGGKGAFVSHWILDPLAMRITRGEDWVHFVNLWNPNAPEIAGQTGYAFNRLCSADLPARTSFYDIASGEGFDGRLLMNGEEDKSGGRIFAHVLTGPEAGVAYELPHFGKAAWENAVANPSSGPGTLVIALDDSMGGQVYAYLGDKQATGNPVERAGLVYGKLTAVRVTSERFDLVSAGDATKMNGAELEDASQKAGATAFARPEDGAWDPRDSRVFYFATTDKIDGASQLLRLTFDDVARPEIGGRFDVLLNARDIGAQMFDNIAVDGDGRVLIAEDPGKHPHLAGLWLYDPARPGQPTRLFEADPARFLKSTGASFMTEDEEISGIVEITDELMHIPWFDANRRYYLATLQAHLPHAEQAVVEHGQLFLISGPRTDR